jgi:hypothetical protein
VSHICPSKEGVMSCTFVLRYVYGNCTYEVWKYHFMCVTVASMYAAIVTRRRIFC